MKLLWIPFLIGSLIPISVRGDNEIFSETDISYWYETLTISSILYKSKTELQDIIFFENPFFGRVLGLDGVVQLTQADEPFYHEMLTHVPLLSHGSAGQVLIIGGGDGGAAREVLRHKEVVNLTLVELDGEVVGLSKEYLPMVSQGAFDSPRLNLVIQNGFDFVKNTTQKFDIIICDSTDPEGPGKVLFSKEFYSYCKRILNPDGIVVTQNGMSFNGHIGWVESFQNLRSVFKDARIFVTNVPTYIGGQMTLGWATDSAKYTSISEKELATRLQSIEGKMRYYTPAVHAGAFVLPQYILDALSAHD